MNIHLPKSITRSAVALGGDLKCRPVYAQGDQAKVLDEVGDLAAPETQDALEALMEKHAPDVLICDRHPGYFSNNLAHRLAEENDRAVIEVQHHRAHVAAVCLEHGLYDEPVVGLAFDGTGYGDDGNVWGGEFFTGTVKNDFARRAHFASLPIPGGDAAVRQPWRIALALMLERGLDRDLIQNWLTQRQINIGDLNLFEKALKTGFAVGRSTALGRWFDTASALLGIRTEAEFEAQPAIELQQAAESVEKTDLTWPLSIGKAEPHVIDVPDLRSLIETPQDQAAEMALAFHRAAAETTAQVSRRLAESVGANKVIASGGCFLNRLFDGLLADKLAALGLEYVKPINLPPGDQALALGQIGLVLDRLDG